MCQWKWIQLESFGIKFGRNLARLDGDYRQKSAFSSSPGLGTV